MPTLRPGTPEDADAVAWVHHRGRRAYYAAAGVDVGADPDPAQLVTWRRALASDARITVADDDGALVGFACADAPQHGGPSGAVELVALHLVPERFGTGLAQRLHAAFVAGLDGHPGVLDVWASNQRAIAFYRRQGWMFDGRTRDGVAGEPFLGMALNSRSPRSSRS